MFPQVAAKFFGTRDQGPKNLGKDPAAKPAAARRARRAGRAGQRQGSGTDHDHLRRQAERQDAQGDRLAG